MPAAYGGVAEHLRRAIHLGVYSPGDKLPPEREHAKQLGVSRVTLREALRVLEGEGYLEMRRGAAGGAMVLSQGQTRAMLRQRLDELLGIQEFRIANEALSARRAATRATKKDLRDLQRTVDVIRDDESQHAQLRADSDFHLRIADIAALPLLRKAVEEARAAMFPQFELMGYVFATGTAIRDHQLIVDAIAAGDAELAEARMIDHIRTTTEEFVEVLRAKS